MTRSVPYPMHSHPPTEDDREIESNDDHHTDLAPPPYCGGHTIHRVHSCIGHQYVHTSKPIHCLGGKPHVH